MDNNPKTGLIIRRKAGERTLLQTSDGPIILEIHKCNSNTFKINLNAPETVKIYRMDKKFYEQASTQEGIS